MTAVFKIAEGVPCRACGAVLAAASENEFGLCKTCWTAACNFNGSTFDMRRNENPLNAMTEQGVTHWLAHKLMLDLRRMEKTGIVGRCEALSGWAYGDFGNQCAHAATTYRDGRKCCRRHALATKPLFVGATSSDHYELLRATLTLLASRDERFAAVIKSVAEGNQNLAEVA